MKLDPRSRPSPELARAIAQLLNEGAPWTSTCRQLGVNKGRATHWRTEQPWFGQLCRLAVMAAFVETIERLNPCAVSKERPHLLDAAARVRDALHAPLPLALESLIEDPPFTVGPEDDGWCARAHGAWRGRRAESTRSRPTRSAPSSRPLKARTSS